jgi:hypothetical protein
MPGAVIYISEFQNKLAWKFGTSVSKFIDDTTVLDPVPGTTTTSAARKHLT